jgi:dihydrofolate reductase/thymidylate synthase
MTQKNKTFSIVVAVDARMGIGKSGSLPWRLSRDMQRFKDVTLPCAAGQQNVLVMGRKTWESLPPRFRPLPGRINVVITSNHGLDLPPGVVRASSLAEALDFAWHMPNAGNVFVIGGGMIFAEALKRPECERLYLTHIDHDFSCDVVFPALPAGFQQVFSSQVAEENGLLFRFADYKK